MEKYVYALAGLLAGLVAGSVVTMRVMEEDFETQQRSLLILHGDRRAVACQLPEHQRPKNTDCREFAR